MSLAGAEALRVVSPCLQRKERKFSLCVKLLRLCCGSIWSIPGGLDRRIPFQLEPHRCRFRLHSAGMVSGLEPRSLVILRCVIRYQECWERGREVHPRWRQSHQSNWTLKHRCCHHPFGRFLPWPVREVNVVKTPLTASIGEDIHDLPHGARDRRGPIFRHIPVQVEGNKFQSG